MSRIDYCPILRGKPGEFLGLHRLYSPIKDQIAPTIVVPSLTAKDVQKRRALSPVEAIRTHIGRISEAWEKRTFLLDTRLIKFDFDDDEDARQLKLLFDSAEQFDCKAIPVIGLRTREKRLDAIRNYIERTSSGVAVRAGIGDIDIKDLETRFSKLIQNAGVNFSDAVLQLDLSDTSIFDTDAFAELLVNSFARFSEIGSWARIIMAASNFPEHNPAKPNKLAIVKRLEWEAWQQAAKADDRIKKSIYGDFGADHGKIVFSDSRGQPITHLRYAHSDCWLVSRGGQSSPEIDGTIRGAALRIYGSKFFSGERFSWGDQFIADCANNLGTPGYPTVWRAANMNHHMTRALTDVGHFIGHEVHRSETRFSPLQQALPL